jgi:6-pyruvoyl-tetrahydropterin synthase
VKSGFSIHVTKENLKFSAAHFIAYPGFREPLHGHNYQVGVRVEGQLADSDFGLIKKVTKEIADRLDERTIIPAKNDCLAIERSGNELSVHYGQDRFIFPLSDVAILPIAHSSAEELAHYIWKELRDALQARNALSGVISIEISVAEGPGQAAIYHEEIAKV